MATHDRPTQWTAATRSTGTAGGPQNPDAVRSAEAPDRSAADADPHGEVRYRALLTTLTAWCQTCGTEVEFAAPTGAAPADLAADERGCVWCGEALVVSCTPVLEPTASAA